MTFIELILVLIGVGIRRCESDPSSSLSSSDDECPLTPDWHRVCDENGISFEQRYDGVTFEPPDCYHFDECYLPVGLNYTKHGAVTSDVLDDKKEENDDMYDRYFSGSDASEFDHLPKNEENHGEASTSVQHEATSQDQKKRYHLTRKDRNIQLPEKDRERVRIQLDQVWDERGLNFDMKPRDLALGIARLKIVWTDIDDSILGTMASNKVRENTSVDYYRRYRLFATGYSKKIHNLRRKINFNHPDCSETAFRQMLYDEVGTLKARTFDSRWSGGGRYSITARESKAQQKALQVGVKLKQIVADAFDNPDVDLRDLDMAQIEYYSRGLSLEHDISKGRTTSMFSLKRFLKRCLDKSDKDLEDLSILRLQHQIRLQDILRRAKKTKGRLMKGVKLDRGRD